MSPMISQSQDTGERGRKIREKVVVQFHKSLSRDLSQGFFPSLGVDDCTYALHCAFMGISDEGS
jgi:hypothetical protein